MELNIKDMTAEQIADAKAQIEAWEARQKVKKLAWKPEKYKTYWAIALDGSSVRYVWNDDNQDTGCYVTDNCHETNKLCKAERERRRVLHQIHEWIDENDAERGGRFIVSENNWILCYNVVGDVLDASCNFTFITSTLPPFSSPEKALQCIKDIGEERIKLLFKRYDIVRGNE